MAKITDPSEFDIIYEYCKFDIDYIADAIKKFWFDQEYIPGFDIWVDKKR